MFCIVALNWQTNKQLGAFLCARRDSYATEKWNASMTAQNAAFQKFKTEQDYAEWLQDRAAAQ